MNYFTQIIAKKRDGTELSREEIEDIVAEYTAGSIPDYQMASFLMAVFFNGLTMKETTALANGMADSGIWQDLSWVKGKTVDKHSTGGVGDKTTLALIPMVASLGLPIFKLSGKSLGHTGGTIDKLQSIPGFQTDFDHDKAKKIFKKTNAVILSASSNLAPADKLIYALRDATATVDSIPLIASSIMSKKLAAGCQAILLDVKYGSGALLNKYEHAIELADLMVGIGRESGREVRAIISDMNQPLGHCIGNTLEVYEAVQFLKGEAAADLMELCFRIGAEMLQMGGIEADHSKARDKLQEAIISGKALAKFKEIVEAQGGDTSAIDDLSKLPQPKNKVNVHLDKHGFIESMDTHEIGTISMLLGAGRKTKDVEIDYTAGMCVYPKIGDFADGKPVATMQWSGTNVNINIDEAVERLKGCFMLSDKPVKKPPLIYKTIK